MNHEWYDVGTEERLVRQVEEGGFPLERLDHMEPPKCPGAYLEFLAAPWLPEMGILAEGRYPVYAGLAQASLRERVGRYRPALKGIRAFGICDVWFLFVECPSSGSAALAERTLIERYRPLFNGMGHGSKAVGINRTGQKCSAFDALFPGRRWAREPSPFERAASLLEVSSYLTRLDPAGPRWEPLPCANANRHRGRNTTGPFRLCGDIVIR
jgi:hypothetical protein